MSLSQRASNIQRIAGQTAVITGAAQGIGLAIAQRLASEGTNLMLSDLAGVLLNIEAAKIAAQCKVKVQTHVGDLSKQGVVRRLHKKSHATFGPAQILVNCAGGGVILPFLEHTSATLKATLDRNLWTAIWCSQIFLPDMLAIGYGRIINIGADSVRNGLWDHAAYNAAKGGMHGLTTGLAREFATQGITCNTVAPCAVATHQLAHFIKTKPKVAQKFLSIIPMGRAGKMEEVASMVAYLAQPEAAFVTGQVISVNGGSTML